MSLNPRRINLLLRIIYSCTLNDEQFFFLPFLSQIVYHFFSAAVIVLLLCFFCLYVCQHKAEHYCQCRCVIESWIRHEFWYQKQINWVDREEIESNVDWESYNIITFLLLSGVNFNLHLCFHHHRLIRFSVREKKVFLSFFLPIVTWYTDKYKLAPWRSIAWQGVAKLILTHSLIPTALRCI